MYRLFLVFFSYLLLHTNLKCNATKIENSDSLDNCTILKDELAKTISEFTLCSVEYARPITLCKRCIYMYIDLLNSYKNMTEMSVNGTKCLHYYVNLDRLEIIETQYSNSINLWDRAKCYECFLVENGTLTPKESSTSKTFYNYYNNFIACTKKADSKILCDQCMDDYVILNNFYESISNSNEKIGVCIDLEDLMNSTWTYWGTNCCKYRKHHEAVFISSTVAVLVLTIVLYISVVQFSREKKAPTIIQQSRFAGSINNIPQY